MKKSYGSHFLLVSIALLMPRCTSNPPQHTPVLSWERGFLENKLAIPNCHTCFSREQLFAFQDSLGSTKLELDVSQIAKAFMGYPFHGESYIPPERFTGTIAHSPYFDTQFYDYHVFLRPRKNDSLPFHAEVFQIDKEKRGPEAKLNVRHLAKLFYDDPVLNDVTGFDPERATFLPDTTFIWTLKEVVGQKLKAGYDPAKIQKRGPVLSLTFFTEGSIGIPSQFKYEGRRESPGNGNHYESAPFEKHYQYEEFVSVQDENGFVFPELPGSAWMLGWASSSDYYLQYDSLNGLRHYHYDIQAKDLAIYTHFGYAFEE